MEDTDTRLLFTEYITEIIEEDITIELLAQSWRINKESYFEYCKKNKREPEYLSFWILYYSTIVFQYNFTEEDIKNYDKNRGIFVSIGKIKEILLNKEPTLKDDFISFFLLDDSKEFQLLNYNLELEDGYNSNTSYRYI